MGIIISWVFKRNYGVFKRIITDHNLWLLLSHQFHGPWSPFSFFVWAKSDIFALLLNVKSNGKIIGTQSGWKRGIGQQTKIWCFLDSFASMENIGQKYVIFFVELELSTMLKIGLGLFVIFEEKIRKWSWKKEESYFVSS